MHRAHVAMGKKALEAQANGLQTFIYCKNLPTKEVRIQVLESRWELNIMIDMRRRDRTGGSKASQGQWFR